MIEKINDLGGIGPVSGAKPRRGAGYGAEGDPARDGLAVSDFARVMANISFEMGRVPEVREDKIDGLKKQIEEGKYDPDLKALAGRLIWAGINKIED
jgi:negative regulator of flagellin synthesis FlgM